VFRYLSPESAATVTTAFPGPRRRPTWIAASTLAPVEVPREDLLLPGEPPGHALRLVGRHRQGGAHQRGLPKRRNVADPDALDLVRPRLTPRQHRRFGGFHRDDLDLGCVPLQDGGHAADGGGRPHTVHERRQSPAGLAPDLLPERVIAGDGVVIVQLVRPVGVGLTAQGPRRLDHVEDQLLRRTPALAWHERELRPVCRHLVQLLPAERVGADDPDAVAPGGAHQGQRRAGAATGVLDHRVAGAQPAVGFSARDDGSRHPVLDAAGGILPLELQEDVGAVGWNDLAERHQRGVADRLKNAHGRDRRRMGLRGSTARRCRRSGRSRRR
jgi:hypothetical protein